MNKFIFLIILMCTSFYAWAEDISSKDWKKREEEEQKMCSKILKHEKDDMVFGYYYTSDGGKAVGWDDNLEPHEQLIGGKCQTFVGYVTVYNYPKDDSQYLVQTYINTATRGVFPDVFLLDKNTCKITKDLNTMIAFSPYQNSKFTYAVYNGDVYGIFRKQEVRWDNKKGIWFLKKTYPPQIENLTSENFEKYRCK